MTIKEPDHILLPGDLHIIMTQLRAIGSFIDMSGLPELWTESGMYSDQVVKRILEGKPLRRSIEAHVVTLQVLFSFLCDEYFKENKEDQIICYGLSQKVVESWKTDSNCKGAK